MKKLILLAMALCLVLGCSSPQKEAAALKIGDIEITAKEFDVAFKASGMSYDGRDSRKHFLERYISRKLILKEAERLGLDKDPEFLESVQLFWEQSLLKVVLSKKTTEYADNIKVSDAEVKAFYDQRKAENYPDQELAEVHGQIKWLLLKQKQSKALKDWVDNLKDGIKIESDKQLLGIN